MKWHKKLGIFLALWLIGSFLMAQAPTIKPLYTMLKDIYDVVITSVADNQVLSYDSTTRKWINEFTLAGSLTHIVDVTNGVKVTGTGAAVLQLYDGTDLHTINAEQETGLGGRLTIGLDETARTLVICDIGDIAADFGLAANTDPRLVVFDASATSRSHITYFGLYLNATAFGITSLNRTNDPLAFNAILDHPIDHMFAFTSSANRGVTDTDAEQAWFYIEPKINQTSTANYVGLLMDVTETSTGSGTNELMALRVAGTDKFTIGNDGGVAIRGTTARGLDIGTTSSSAQLYIGGSGILASGEQAIYINTPTETVATNGLWITLGSTVTSGDMSGVRSRVTGNAASSGANIRGGYLEAKSGASKYVAMLEGVLSHADYSAGSVTVSGDVRGLTSHISQGSGLNAANLYGILATVQTRGDETITTNDYIMRLNNEAVGGAGRQMDGAIQVVDTNVSASGFGYGLDLSGAAIATADIVLQNGETIDNTTDGIVKIDGNVEVTGIVYFDAETTQSVSAAFTVDWNTAQKQRVTITGANLDMSFTDPPGPCNLVLVVVQGDGSDTIDWTHDTKIGASGGTAPTLSTGSGNIDVFGFYFDGTHYWLTYTKNFSLIT